MRREKFVVYYCIGHCDVVSLNVNIILICFRDLLDLVGYERFSPTNLTSKIVCGQYNF
jgi:hypothetical protein